MRRKIDKNEMTRFKKEISRNHKTIRQLLEKYGKVRVIMARTNYDHSTNSYVVNHIEHMRRRILTKKGSSKMSLQDYDDRKKWSGYSESCFLYGKKVKDYKHTLKLMRSHDGVWIKPIEIHYGLFFRKKIEL